jgi:hypothetical protein
MAWVRPKALFFTRFPGLFVVAVAAFLCVFLISATEKQAQESTPYDLEFQTMNISGSVGGSASYSVEDALTHMGNGSGIQTSTTYSVGSLFQTEGITGIEDHRWTGLR